MLLRLLVVRGIQAIEPPGPRMVVGLRNGCGIVKPVLVADRFEKDGRIAVPQEYPLQNLSECAIDDEDH
ncbi:MAG: hypothetical protein OXE05_00425 [Chloroflexi bacterium]|nr:hypothetical protein [Chloroflexota bacterium]